MENTITQNDIEYILKRKNLVSVIQTQLQFFINGIDKINLVDFATYNNGICQFDDQQSNAFCAYFDKHKNRYEIQKFVPSSGAASRMFKFLLEFLSEFQNKNQSINAYINQKKATDLSVFLAGIKEFPFYDLVKTKLIDLYPDYKNKNREEKEYLFIKTLLSNSYFDFSNKPKGVLPFHKKQNRLITPVEEHLNEAAFYEKKEQKTKIHFTISKEHQHDFETICAKYPNFEITFSYQSPTTDTIAVDYNNAIFRLENGNLFFRPGGHGALIENLNNLEADIVFIKNIDNVSHNHLDQIIKYKKMLGGVLFRAQHQIFNYLQKLQFGKISTTEMTEIVIFMQQKLLINLSQEFDNFKPEYKISYLIKRLNKPIRVCGMVKNEGEPGGGPFWVKDANGNVSLQIVETSQIDMTNPKQVEILKNATHFNPVDIVCGIKDYTGKNFDLNQFVDQNSGFIVEKTKNQKPIKAYELPGLWNGAMANWLTIFVEVPLATFNPVKTVNDLLKPAHQPS